MDPKQIRYHQFFGTVMLRVPEFTPVYREHIIQNDGLHPQLLMEALTHFVCQSSALPLKSSRPREGNPSARSPLFDLFEENLKGGHPEIVDLISSSFVKPLSQRVKGHAEFQKWLGPTPLKELHRYE